MMLRHALSVVRNEPMAAPHIAWDVFLGTNKLDTVYYNPSCTAQYVRETLIKHDRLDPEIVVRRSK
jgi:hypothetical protein